MKRWLNKSLNNFVKLSKRSWKHFKKNYVKIGFYILALILLINAVLMTLHLINRDYSYKILNRLYIEAILPDQDLTSRMFTGIAKIEAIDYATIAIGDKVVFCCDYGLEENWVQEVVAIDRENKLLELTYDGVATTIAGEEAVYGFFLKEANFFGTLYYTASFPRGYILLMASQLLFLYIYHYTFIQKRSAEINMRDEGESHLEDS